MRKKLKNRNSFFVTAHQPECSIFDLTVRLASEFGQKLFRRLEYQQNLSYLGFVPLRRIGSG
jgi:hypothetical protein